MQCAAGSNWPGLACRPPRPPRAGLTRNSHRGLAIGQITRSKVPVMSAPSTTPSAGTAPRRAHVAGRTKLDFWFDAIILLAYTVAYSYGFTGVVIHEWLGIGIGIALLLHLTLCVASGIAISRVALPELGITTLQTPFWFRLHVLTAEVTVGLVPVHVALRWRWIAGVGRRMLVWRPRGRSQ